MRRDTSSDGTGDRRRVPRPPRTSAVARVVDRNIQALILRRAAEDRHKSPAQRVADTVTAFTGSIPFLMLHVVVFGIWIVINLGWIPHVPRFDPTFVILAMVASVEAIFLSTFVLMSQNRMAEMDARRADLDLQVSLLAEHELTRLVGLVTEMAKRMGIAEAADPELQELRRDLRPEQVLERMDAHEEVIERGAEERT